MRYQTPKRPSFPSCVLLTACHLGYIQERRACRAPVLIICCVHIATDLRTFPSCPETSEHSPDQLSLNRWRGTPAHAPGIPAPLLQPLPRAHVHVAVQLGARLLPVYEIAEAAADAALARIQATTGLAEIRHGGKFAVDGATCVPARVERVAGLLRVFLVLEADVDVADQICRVSC